MGIFRELRLIIWKNSIIRKRHWFLTAVEIIMPIILFGLVAYGRSKITGMSKQLVQEPTFMDISTSSDLENHVPVGEMQLLYAPHNNFTYQIMTKVQEVFQIPGSDKRNFRSKDDLLKYYHKHSDLNIYAVIFDTSNAKKLSYEISIHGKMLDWGTDRLYVPFQGNPEVDGSSTYLYKGFLGLQYVINKAFLELNTDKSADVKLTLQRFPYPPHTLDSGIKNLFLTALPLITIFSFIFLCPAVLKRVVEEKSSGIKELMKMVGMKSWMIWFGWFAHALFTNLISIGVIVFLMKVCLWDVPYPPIEHCDAAVLFVFLFLYCMAAITFCFVIASLFDKPSVAMVCGIIIWVFSYFIPKSLLETYDESLGWKTKMALALFPNIALQFGYESISTYEIRETGVHWSNLFKSAEGSGDDITMGSVLNILLFDTFLFMIITIYVDNVKPGQYGIAKPFYYPFMEVAQQFVKLMKRFSSSKVEPPELRCLNNMELGKAGKTPCIEVRKLTKRYGPHVVVDCLDMNIYENQITVLLGHNGAGKTTTMSIMTGMTSATSGTVLIHGKNINKSMSDVRENMGLCPQHNLLFPDLTVKEQLLFFAMLKGKTPKEATEQANRLLEEFSLTDKSNNLACTLSGGMKRKLCLGMALIGDTNLLILDEPTAGMDTESRRKVWNLLKEQRNKRTILITTHFMEEADALADEIKILSNGHLTCDGTPMELKNKYATGYHLSLMRDDDDPDKMETIKSVLHEGTLLRENGKNIVFLLPMSQKHLYAEIIKRLENRKEELGINKIGLSVTTLTDVFLKANDECSSRNSQSDTDSIKKNVGKLADLRCLKRNKSAERQWKMLNPLLRKRWYFFKNKIYWYIPAVIVTFLIFLTVVCLGAGSTNYYGKGGPQLDLNLTFYGKTGVFFSGPEDVEIISKLKKFYAQSVEEQKSIPIETNNVSKAIIDEGVENIVYYNKHLLAAAQFEQHNHMIIVNAMYSGNSMHGAPISINLAMNAMAKALLGPEYSIDAMNSPLKKINTEYSPSEISEIQVGLLWFILIPFGMVFFMTNFIIFPNFEISTNFIQIQFMAGVNIFSYWISNLIFDISFGFLKMLFIGLLICLVDAVCYDLSIFHKEEYGALAVIFAMYLVCNMPFCYLFCYKKTIAGGFALFVMIAIFMGIIPTLIVYVLDSSQDKYYMEIAYYLKYVLLSICPQFALSFFSINFAAKYVQNHNWVNMAQEKRLHLCQIQPNPCCGGENTLECNTYKSYFHNEKHGLHLNWMWMFIGAVFYFTILMLIGLKCWQRLKVFALKWRNKDEDEADEVDYHKRCIVNPEEKALKAEHLQIYYDRKPVVNIKELELKSKQCYGLLGVNGAGKSTTFKSLTRDIVYNKGDIFIADNGEKININQIKYSKSIGYCPQGDSLNYHLTGRQILAFIGLLRGHDLKDAEESAKLLIENFGLDEHADKPCLTYSGGNKRKLNTCIAFMGTPQYILLDEPTNGVDPASRCNFWNTLSTVKKMKDTSFLLCSHSMEECEALCDYISIMKKGKIQARGAPLELKNEHNSGYTVTFQLKQLPEATDEVDCGNNSKKKNKKEPEIPEELKKDVMASLGENTTLLDESNHNMLTLNVRDPNIQLSHLFEIAEDLKQRHHKQIEDYTVNETSLEDVFLSVARSDSI